MAIQPYLYFNGRCEEAMAYYRDKLGAEVTFSMKFGESPDQTNVRPEMRDKVMHCNFTVGETQLMASDGMCGGNARFEGISLAYETKSAEEAEALFTALAQDGQVQMPLVETFFSPRFGMVADKFGVSWLLTVAAPAAG